MLINFVDFSHIYDDNQITEIGLNCILPIMQNHSMPKNKSFGFIGHANLLLDPLIALID